MEQGKYKKHWTYILAGVVFISSAVLAYCVQTNEIFKGILALLSAGSLFVALYEIYKDNRMHEHNIELQNKQQDFILGTASHVADTIYDKHVIFCEEYMERVLKCRQELFSDGPSKKAFSIGKDLMSIRLKHNCWLTLKIENALKPFEKALIKIGAEEQLLESLPIGEQRHKVIEGIYKSFGLVLGDEKDEIAIDKIIEEIRRILGVDILTKLRERISEVAIKRLDG